MSTTAQHRASPPQARTRLGPPSTPAQSWDTYVSQREMYSRQPSPRSSCQHHPPLLPEPNSGWVLLKGSQTVPEGHLRTFRAPGSPASECSERMGTQWVLRADGSWGVCAQGQGVPGSGVSEQE